MRLGPSHVLIFALNTWTDWWILWPIENAKEINNLLVFLFVTWKQRQKYLYAHKYLFLKSFLKSVVCKINVSLAFFHLISFLVLEIQTLVCHNSPILEYCIQSDIPLIILEYRWLCSMILKYCNNATPFIFPHLLLIVILKIILSLIRIYGLQYKSKPCYPLITSWNYELCWSKGCWRLNIKCHCFAGKWVEILLCVCTVCAFYP